MTRLKTAKAMRSAGHSLAQIGAALNPPVSASTVGAMLKRNRERTKPFEYFRMAPWLVQQLDFARHRKYIGIHKI